MRNWHWHFRYIWCSWTSAGQD